MDFETDTVAPFMAAVDKINWPTSRNLNRALYDSLGEKYSYLPHNTWSLSELTDTIRRQIKSTIHQSNGKISSTQLFKKIASHLNYRRLLNNEQNEKYINAAHFLFDMTRENCTIEDSTRINWPAIADMLYDLSRVSNFYDMSPIKITLFESNRENAVGTAMKSLRQFGCTPEVKDGDVYLKDTDFQAVNKLIEKEIQAYGGINLLKFHFSRWHSNTRIFNTDQQRFNFIIETNTMGKKTAASLPLGYLVNLCLKHPTHGRPEEQTPQRLKKIHEWTTLLVSALDVEAFSSWETEFKSGRSAIALMQEVALMDSNFKLQQISPQYFLTMIEGLFSWVKNEGLDSTLPLTYDDIFDYCKFIDQQIQNQHIPKEYTYSEVIPPSAPPPKRTLLEKYMIHQEAPNKEFLSPTDWDKVDATFKPFIDIGGKSFFGMNAGWVALATIEAILNYFREHLKNFDGRLGLVIETFVKAEAGKKGLTVFSGEYVAYDQNDAEIDVAADLTDLIPFMEIKKKPLTRLSKSGIDDALLVDLSKSLLDSQIQILRHELTLRKKGSINSKTGATLNWNDREFERISVCLFDYGGLQDRTIIRQLMSLFYRSQFSHPDPKMNTKMQDLNVKTTKLGDLYDEWLQETGGSPNIHFFNCWFLSVPQILLLLDGVSTDREFKDNLLRTKHMTMKTLDFYYEYSYMKTMN